MELLEDGVDADSHRLLSRYGRGYGSRSKTGRTPRS